MSDSEHFLLIHAEVVALREQVAALATIVNFLADEAKVPTSTRLRIVQLRDDIRNDMGQKASLEAAQARNTRAQGRLSARHTDPCSEYEPPAPKDPSDL